MGLDMYLNKRIYVGANYEHNKITGVIDLKKDGKTIQVDLKKVTNIEEQLAYWRKANQIHQWFVTNVQEGKDDCGDYDVSPEQLKELVDLYKVILSTAKTVDGQVWSGTSWSQKEGEVHSYKDGKVIVNQDEIEKLLPSKSGFFFGKTDYDEDYMRDLQNTINQLEPILEEEGDFIYHASW